ncbi:MAG: FAD-dependent oxidoreductase [Sulfurovum sp.]|nr:FAD-dependent oxidoreductase [Sulfurovum sp.]
MVINKLFDTAIIGSGVAGSALLFTLARYTDIRNIILFEKYDEPALLNSGPKANSQTLHVGDIETNYTLDKAKIVKANASMISNYINHFGYEESIGFRRDKMILAVGDDEISRLEHRYREFAELFPYFKKMDKDELVEREPKIMEGRKENIMALGVEDEITTVDFKKLSESFVQMALDEDKNVQMHYNEEVVTIKELDSYFEIVTKNSTYQAKTVVANAGAYSLLFAQRLGYGLNLAVLPIGGSFFFTKKKLLDSKVYTMQNPKLPFAAVHADPDMTANWNTRFGPTAFALPKLERYRQTHIKDLLKAMCIDRDTLEVYYDLLRDKIIRKYILTNFLDEIPFIGKSIFVKDARKIIPTLTKNDLEFADGYGGMRPQIIDKTKHELMMGEAKLVKGGAIFNMTPSPGASTSLAIAHKDTVQICEFLGKAFDRDLHEKEIVGK